MLIWLVHIMYRLAWLCEIRVRFGERLVEGWVPVAFGLGLRASEWVEARDQRQRACGTVMLCHMGFGGPIPCHTNWALI